MFSILHISDIHRSRNEPIDNDSLIAALLADRDRYMGETPIVPPPSAIVVSGDLVQGAQVAEAGWEDAIRDQFSVASSFLDQLTLRFLDGDRSRVIVVPGNHDVCWNTSFAAMERVDDANYPDDVRGALTAPDSNYRWSWKERALYRICDAKLYRQRLHAYWEFVKTFYAGVALPKPIDPLRGYQLFELQDRRVVVAAFDSITGNDCFGYSGAIPPGAVARCSLDLRDIDHTYDLRVAVWHHSIHGPPTRDDYMDLSQVEEIVGLGFQLGMHGHQYVSATATHHVYLAESQSMAVVSSGSLCAGARELPRGINRQYNMIVVEDGLQRGRAHLREMVEGGQFSRKGNGEFIEGSVAIGWQKSIDAMGHVVVAREENSKRAILLAEQALMAGDARIAIQLLHGVDLSPESYARRIAIEAASDLKDWNVLVATIGEPRSTEDAVLLVSALIHTNAVERAETILKTNLQISPGTRSDLESLIETKRVLGGA